MDEVSIDLEALDDDDDVIDDVDRVWFRECCCWESEYDCIAWVNSIGGIAMVKAARCEYLHLYWLQDHFHRKGASLKSSKVPRKPTMRRS